MTNYYRFILILLITVLFSGCAALSPSFQKPEVEVVAVEPLPTRDGNNLRFRIHLRVFNPNNSELALSGLFYTLRLGGHKVLTGTSNNLMPIAPYGQDDIAVDATASIVGSIFAAVNLINLNQHSIPYELEAKIGLRKSLLPSIKVNRSGVIHLNQYR
ncbi:LEA type 2 family protein [Microbulbifer sp. VAAC004]|uniref:LEA type 2 family protein n=1 Tax=Microbulbifer variabilis TaxID=266805 RepID=A0ABY4VM03_9GAMM|nr:LEA type 2 family protein [Microbulbifer variabilis]USD23477.1 LEA type 2 family protein [Microbulbifer variabilis]